MARRKIEEINAGSMADIAFLLLIFFLVTTTMEVDAGIGKNLPLKLDVPPPPPPPFNERNVLKINANLNDDLMVESEDAHIDELRDIVYTFYTANRLKNDQDMDMPNYTSITLADCQQNIDQHQLHLVNSPNDTYVKNELSKWQTKLELCQISPGKTYREISTAAVIQLKIQANTSYGLYIQIHNIIQQVINELRVEMCKKMEWGDYFLLKKDNPSDQEIIKKLRVLVPERIIEPKISS